jgi:hypothetical protein
LTFDLHRLASKAGVIACDLAILLERTVGHTLIVAQFALHIRASTDISVSDPVVDGTTLNPLRLAVATVEGGVALLSLNPLRSLNAHRATLRTLGPHCAAFYTLAALEPRRGLTFDTLLGAHGAHLAASAATLARHLLATVIVLTATAAATFGAGRGRNGERCNARCKEYPGHLKISFGNTHQRPARTGVPSIVGKERQLSALR